MQALKTWESYRSFWHGDKGEDKKSPIGFRQTSTNKVGHQNRSIGKSEAPASFSIEERGDVSSPRAGATTPVPKSLSRALINATKIPDFAKPSSQVQLLIALTSRKLLRTTHPVLTSRRHWVDTSLSFSYPLHPKLSQTCLTGTSSSPTRTSPRTQTRSFQRHRRLQRSASYSSNPAIRLTLQQTDIHKGIDKILVLEKQARQVKLYISNRTA